MDNKQIEVCEVYPTVGVYGEFSGRKAIVFRMFGTNTKNAKDKHIYAWDTSDKDRLAKNRMICTQTKAINLVKKHLKTTKFVHITGGEPLVQEKALIEFTQKFKEKFPQAKLIMETNGLITPSTEVLENLSGVVLNLKLSSSVRGNASSTYTSRINNENVELYLKKFGEDAVFLFDIMSEADVQEIANIVEKFKLNRTQVWLSPWANNRATAEKLLALIWERGKTLGYNVSLDVTKVIAGLDKRAI